VSSAHRPGKPYSSQWHLGGDFAVRAKLTMFLHAVGTNSSRRPSRTAQFVRFRFVFRNKLTGMTSSYWLDARLMLEVCRREVASADWHGRTYQPGSEYRGSAGAVRKLTDQWYLPCHSSPPTWLRTTTVPCEFQNAVTTGNEKITSASQLMT